MNITLSPDLQKRIAEKVERGEGRPAEEVFADLRARHGISR
jgi:hypothetical protein